MSLSDDTLAISTANTPNAYLRNKNFATIKYEIWKKEKEGKKEKLQKSCARAQSLTNDWHFFHHVPQVGNDRRVLPVFAGDLKA